MVAAAKQNAPWWDSARKETWGASLSPTLNLMDAAVSDRSANRRDESRGEELSPSEVVVYGASVREARRRGFVAWGNLMSLNQLLRALS